MRSANSPKLNTTIVARRLSLGLAALLLGLVLGANSVAKAGGDNPDGKTPPAPTTVQFAAEKIPFCRKRRSCHHYGHPHGRADGKHQR